MKTNYLSMIIGLVSMVLLACEKTFDDMNVDPNRPSSATPGVLLGQLQYQIVNNKLSGAKDMTHTLMQVTAPRADNSVNSTMRWFIGPESGIWENYYSRLLDVNDLYRIGGELEEPNYQAISLILKSYIFSILTDLYGDVPYTDASKGEEGLFEAAFDRQEAIYTAMLSDLKTANESIQINQPLSFGGDLIYGADKAASMLKWKKFCNALRLRLLLRLMNRDAEFGVTAQVNEILSDLTNHPIFEGNNDEAIFHYPGVYPYFNPYYNARTFDWRDNHYYTAFFLEQLNTWNDPRREIWSRTVNVNGQTIYRGIVSGYQIGTEYDVNANSNYTDEMKTLPQLGIIMSYAELEFILAELAIRGFVTPLSAKQHYEKGIAGSIQQWGLNMPADYLEQEGIAFVTEDANFDQQLEQIMLQKYYALFFTDYQSWFEKRRTGYPTLPRGEGIPAGRTFPSRFPYPLYLQSINKANLDDAIAAMGGDDCYIRVWWDNK